MKSRDLIAALEKIDPSGETEVCIDNCDILIPEMMSSSYDGSLKLLVRDPNRSPYYNIVGVKEVRDGAKIVLRYLSLEDVVYEDLKNEVIYEGSEMFLNRVDELRKKRDSLI